MDTRLQAVRGQLPPFPSGLETSLVALASEFAVKTFHLVNQKHKRKTGRPPAPGPGDEDRVTQEPAAGGLGADVLLPGLALRTPGGLPGEHPALGSAAPTEGQPPARHSAGRGPSVRKCSALPGHPAGDAGGGFAGPPLTQRGER